MSDDILNVAFKAPDWVIKGIKSGELKLFGGVVRNQTGQIVHFLEEALTRNTKNVNKIPIVIGAAIILVVVGGAYYFKKRFKPNKEQLLVNQLNNVDKSIKNYCSKDNFASLKRSDIENLIKAFTDLLENPNFDSIEIDKNIQKKLLEFSGFIDKNTRQLSLAKGQQPQLHGTCYRNNLSSILKRLTINLEEQVKLLYIK